MEEVAEDELCAYEDDAEFEPKLVGGDAGTQGASATASGGKKDATTVGSHYYKGMAVFTIVKGGAMFQASVAGQKFSYEPKDDSSK